MNLLNAPISTEYSVVDATIRRQVVTLHSLPLNHKKRYPTIENEIYAMDCSLSISKTLWELCPAKLVQVSII